MVSSNTSIVKNLYLDIDGVILDKRGCPAYGLEGFLRFAIVHFSCFWLTTHCSGNAKLTLSYLTSKVPKEALELMSGIRPTAWSLWKTEAIDFTKPFYWLDDYAFDGERKVLREHRCESSLILINLETNPKQLEALCKQLKETFSVATSP
jgi:hypothetical protein